MSNNRNGYKSGAVFIFIGCLLIVIFIVGVIQVRNPAAFLRTDRYDFVWERFVSFCGNVWLPAGIIGFPLFLVSLVFSLRRESKESKRH